MVQLLTSIRGDDIPDPDLVIPPQMEAAIAEALALLEREVIKRTPIGATGVTRGSIASEMRTRRIGRGVTVRGELGSTRAHIDALERGRKPGKAPPSEALELWVRRKLGINDPKEIKAVAFLIARKIGARGTKGAAMFFEAAEKNESKVMRIFERHGLNVAVELSR